MNSLPQEVGNSCQLLPTKRYVLWGNKMVYDDIYQNENYQNEKDEHLLKLYREHMEKYLFKWSANCTFYLKNVWLFGTLGFS